MRIKLRNRKKSLSFRWTLTGRHVTIRVNKNSSRNWPLQAWCPRGDITPQLFIIYFLSVFESLPATDVWMELLECGHTYVRTYLRFARGVDSD